jgi:hypothetical protein
MRLTNCELQTLTLPQIQTTGNELRPNFEIKSA